MNKRFAFLFFCIVLCQSLWAQKYKHEVSIGIGNGNTNYIRWESASGEKDKNWPIYPIHLQYLYNVNKHIGVGALLDFDYCYEQTYLPVEKYNEEGRFIGSDLREQKLGTGWFSISPVARFYWFNTKYFAMYSRVGLGITLSIGQESNLVFQPNVSPISMEIGGTRMRAYAELLSIGTLGIVNAGFKFSF